MDPPIRNRIIDLEIVYTLNMIRIPTYLTLILDQNGFWAQTQGFFPQIQLFDNLGSVTENCKPQIQTTSTPMSKIEKLRNEKILLGFYISGNPLEDYKEFLININSPATGDLSILRDRDQFRICGIVGTITKKFTQKDNRMLAFFTFDTENVQYKMNCFPDAYEKLGQKLQEGSIAMVTGNVRFRDSEISFNVSDIEPLNYAIARLTKTATWLLDGESSLLSEFLEEFKSFVIENDGSVELVLIFEFCDWHQEKAKLASSLRSSLDIKTIGNFVKTLL